ncbi:MAG: hypothetical protein QM767_25110 [Anaeromyxobacter sp.]
MAWPKGAATKSPSASCGESRWEAKSQGEPPVPAPSAFAPGSGMPPSSSVEPPSV